MNIILSHIGLDWMIASIVVVTGLLLFARHIIWFDGIALTLSIAVWVIAWKMHGNGSVTGAMTATGAVFIWDLLGYPTLKAMIWVKRKI